MIQSVEGNRTQPLYNAVKINITKPEVNIDNNTTRGVNQGVNQEEGVNQSFNNKGAYSAVCIDIDNPTITVKPRKLYEYPQAETIIPFDMAYTKPLELPKAFHVAYQTTNVILPHVDNEIEYEYNEADDDIEESEEITDDEQNIDKNNASLEEDSIVVAQENNDITTEAENVPLVPEPNYTTVEEEKDENIKDVDLTTSPSYISANTNDEENNYIQDDLLQHTALNFRSAKSVINMKNSNNINFKATDNVKRPEIVPGTEIKPEVDISLVLSNLSNKDYDVQAQQMEEIARISLDNPENAVPYIVREVFANLIHITKNDTSKLATPTPEQINARKKIIANVLSLENAKDKNELPFKLTAQEIELANEISPMEQAERNKEYALYTMAILAKVYTDEVEKQTGNIVPMTDVPGVSAMVDALRYNPNAGVKIAAIDSLAHIARPEYHDELNTIFTLAQADNNSQVAIVATSALQRINPKS